MPELSFEDQILLHNSTLSRESLELLAKVKARSPFPKPAIIAKITLGRLALAGLHLHDGGKLLAAGQFRSSISRHYYSMYHSARAITFMWHEGDDYEQHSKLPRNLPSDLIDQPIRSQALTEARLLRNQADYDIYPAGENPWRVDAENLAASAAAFVAACDAYYRGEK